LFFLSLSLFKEGGGLSDKPCPCTNTKIVQKEGENYRKREKSGLMLKKEN